MRRASWTVVLGLCVSLGCGSSSSGSGTDAPVGGDAADAAPARDVGTTAADTIAADGTGAADGPPAADGPAADGTTADGVAADHSALGDVQASQDCVKYCQCMAMNCPDKTFPDGCLQDCNDINAAAFIIFHALDMVDAFQRITSGVERNRLPDDHDRFGVDSGRVT